MKKHKWEEIKCSTQAFKCRICGCEKHKIRIKWGGWEYWINRRGYVETLVSRPDCI